MNDFKSVAKQPRKEAGTSVEIDGRNKEGSGTRIALLQFGALNEERVADGVRAKF